MANPVLGGCIGVRNCALEEEFRAMGYGLWSIPLSYNDIAVINDGGEVRRGCPGNNSWRHVPAENASLGAICEALAEC